MSADNADYPALSASPRSAASRRLVCPYCGSDLDFELEYTGGPFSEHRDLTGIECSNFHCLARWTPHGDVEASPESTETAE